MTHDTLTQALLYALDQSSASISNAAAFNASGFEPSCFEKHSFLANKDYPQDSAGPYATITLRATRQHDETLGMIAHAYQKLTPDGRLFVAQSNAHGAPSLQKKISAAFGVFEAISKHKCRIVILSAGVADKACLAQWRTRAGLQLVPATKMYSMPGLFSWDELDKGSRLLLAHLPDSLKGIGADFGCGYGYLSAALAQKPGIKHLYALDIDARALDATKANLQALVSPCPHDLLWVDVTKPFAALPKLDWAVANVPFHTQQHENRAMGQAFCASILGALKPKGTAYLVANRHMPYESLLEKTAARVELIADSLGFKVFEVQAR